MKTSQRGVDLIKEFEGFSAKAYQDVVGVWTIGYGSTKNVKPGDTITKAEAERRLREELVEYEQVVEKSCTVRPNQNQFDALVSFCYNIGPGNFRKSSVLKAHNRSDFQAAARAFALWNRAGGKVLPGLTRRRMAEATLYLTPVETVQNEVRQFAPQQVDPERPMSQSKIVRASFVAGSTATLATTAEIVTSAVTIKHGVESLDVWLVPLLLVITVAAAGWAIYERFKQRKEGLA